VDSGLGVAEDVDNSIDASDGPAMVTAAMVELRDANATPDPGSGYSMPALRA
jgi:hypothetical protein